MCSGGHRGALIYRGWKVLEDRGTPALMCGPPDALCLVLACLALWAWPAPASSPVSSLTLRSEHLFNLKFAAKELNRNAKKCDKEEKVEKAKIKKVRGGW